MQLEEVARSFQRAVDEHGRHLRSTVDHLVEYEDWREAYLEPESADTWVDLEMLEVRIRVLNERWQELVDHLSRERDFLLTQIRRRA